MEGLKPGTGILPHEITLPAKRFFLTPKNMEMLHGLIKQKFYSIGWKHCNQKINNSTVQLVPFLDRLPL